MPIIELKNLEIKEHRSCAAVVDLVVHGFEIANVSSSMDGNFHRCVAPFVTPRRDHPTRLSHHDDVETIGDLVRINAFALNSDGGFSDHPLQPTNAALVSTPISLI